MTSAPLGTYSKKQVRKALAEERLFLELGPFSTRLAFREAHAVDYFLNTYTDYSVSLGETQPSDFSLKLRAPSLLRTYLRPQIVPDPGFYFPAVPLPTRLSPLCLEMGMNLCVALQCFRYVIFHAGVVACEKGAIVIAAKSGGGKSTLTSALMEQGYRLLSDEFAILDTDDTTLLGYPRPVSLKNESIDVVRSLAGAEQVSETLVNTPKGDIAYRRARRFDLEQAHVPAKARVLIFPRFQAGALPSATQMDLADAAMQLIASSPNYQIIGETAFKALMRLIDSVKAYEITYGNTQDSLKLVSDLLEANTDG